MLVAPLLTQNVIVVVICISRLKDEESAIDVTKWSSTVMQKGLVMPFKMVY